MMMMVVLWECDQQATFHRASQPFDASLTHSLIVLPLTEPLSPAEENEMVTAANQPPVAQF